MMPGIVNLPKLASFALLAALVGCASAPRPVTQQVDIPVFTPCVKKEIPKPAFEFDKLPATAADGDKILALVRDWPRGRKYEGELEAAIAGCR